MKIKYFVAFSILLPIHASYAANDQVSAVRSITLINAYDTFVFIHFSPSYTSTQGCTNSQSDQLVVIDTTNELGKNIYSAALTAAAAQKKVGFGVAGCHIDRPKLYRIDVKFQ